ncbi:MAG: hypothetical protein V4673_14455 [Pseudomonadota bacterium]
MSIATMNWALQQRLESPLHQVLLYVIADSAAPDGTTRHCDSEYLIDRSRMSRATVFRKLADLRDWGLVETFTHHGERGQQIYEVRLQLKKFIDMPIRKRRSSDEDGESHSETPAENGQNDDVESQSETAPQSHSETAAVAPVRPGQSQSGDRIDPTVSEDSPQAPQAGGCVSSDDDGEGQAEPEHFAEFWQGYPDHEVMATCRPKALALFRAMTEPEREHARAAVLLLGEQLRRLKRKPKNAHLWLQAKGWLEYPGAKLPTEAAAAPEPIWYAEASDEARALAVAYALVGEQLPEGRYRDGYVDRWIRRAEPVSADMLPLAEFTPDDVANFVHDHVEGTGECEAWRSRLATWTGRAVKVRRIWLEPYDPRVHGLSATHPDFRFRKHINGLRVPWTWPPRKDGTLIAEPEPVMTDSAEDFETDHAFDETEQGADQ